MSGGQVDGAMPSVRIGDRYVGPDHPCFVVAEVGVNHNGSLDLARQLIDAAADAGADAVKFQSFRVSELILPAVDKAAYQQRSSTKGETQTEMLHRLAVSDEFHIKVMAMCAERSITYLSTPYDVASLDFLVDQGVSAIKIASTDANNLWFLEQVADRGITVLLSTGMTTASEIQDSYRCLRSNGCDQLLILQCTSAYPTANHDVHLRSMSTLGALYPVPIGFSDHTPGIGASPYAVARGACLIEKHVTLDRTMDGPDHAASIQPAELAQLVTEVRTVEEYLGSGAVEPTRAEADTRRSLQRSVVTRRALEAGEIIASDSVTMMRTGGRGIPAAGWNQVKGRRVERELGAGVVVEWSDLEELS